MAHARHHGPRPPAFPPPAPQTPTARRVVRALAGEAGKAAVLATILTLILITTTPVAFGAQTVEVAAAAGSAVAVAARAVHRSHRALAAPLGRTTAAAALTAGAGVLCATVMFIPAHCPGRIGTPGRCSVQEASTWGLALSMATAVNFALAWFTLAAARHLRKLYPAAHTARDVAARWLPLGANRIHILRRRIAAAATRREEQRLRQRDTWPDRTTAAPTYAGWRPSDLRHTPRPSAGQIAANARRREDDRLNGRP